MCTEAPESQEGQKLRSGTAEHFAGTPLESRANSEKVRYKLN